jgi:tRNA (guanine-N7-)-methyltransferase
MDVLDNILDLSPEFLKKRESWEEVFHNQNPLVLDIGCGKGHFLAEMAFKNPKRNFLAIEIYKKGVRNTKKKIQALELNNVRIISCEARFVLSNFFYPGEISEIYINFPDPWPKTRHWKRRLINPSFVDILHPLLENEGRIHIATDFKGYVPVILKCFEEHSGFINFYKETGSLFERDRGYTHHLEERIESLYERKFREKNQLIYYFIFIKKEAEEKSDD